MIYIVPLLFVYLSYSFNLHLIRQATILFSNIFSFYLSWNLFFFTKPFRDNFPESSHCTIYRIDIKNITSFKNFQYLIFFKLSVYSNYFNFISHWKKFDPLIGTNFDPSHKNALCQVGWNSLLIMVFLFVLFGPLEFFSLIYSAHMAIEQWGFFSVPHLLQHRTSVYNSHRRWPVTLTPTPSVLTTSVAWGWDSNTCTQPSDLPYFHHAGFVLQRTTLTSDWVKKNIYRVYTKPLHRGTWFMKVYTFLDNHLYTYNVRDRCFVLQ